MALLYFIASLFFLAPLIAIISGTFYSLGLMSAIDHFVKGAIWYPLWHSPVLISTEQKRNWSVVFKENKKELILFTVVILALLVFGAWFEVWGY